ncbi:MAG: fructosamine kinase family protein [Phycisphaerales bacterium]|jgi:fructosamine-3-kinase|nr:fructosamine kinase family protein [Phycisphaerales bacterium]
MIDLIRRALRAARLDDVTSLTSLSGGSIHNVQLAVLASGAQIVCKVASGADGYRMLESEQRSLALLRASGAGTVPQVLGGLREDAAAVLLLEYLPPGTDPDWSAAGWSLATIHEQQAGGRYGSEHEVWLGTTCFPGGWFDDWAAWIAERRLRPLLRSAADAGAMGAGEVAAVERLCGRIHALVPSRPQPSLLHGDLWSGNVHVCADGQVAFLDPACFIGDAWMDPAMTLLFGGVPAEFLDAWRDQWGDHEQCAERIAVGQAMHLLNHVRMFGAAYVSQLMGVVSNLS